MFLQNIFSRTIGSGKNKSAKKPDIGYIIKITVTILALLGSIVYFSVICRNLVNDYFIILTPTVKTTVPLAIHLCVSALLVAMMVGINEVLVRPRWLVFVTILLATMAYVITIGPNKASWIMGIIFFIIISLHFMGTYNQFKNQISFSPFPISNKKMILFLILAIIAGVAFAQGYSKDAEKQSYIVPPQVKAPVVEMIIGQAKIMIESQQATPEQKTAALNEIRPKVDSLVNDWEKKLEPYPNAVPWVLGILFFSVAQMAFFVISLLFAIFLSLLFYLLKVTRFANYATEMREVKWLTLETVQSKGRK